MTPRPSSNFAFLKAAWPDLALEAMKAERNTAADPRGACFYARRALELGVHWLYDADRSLRRPYREDLSAMLFEPSFQAAVEQRIRVKMDFIRKQGNAAVHDRRPIKAEAALGVVKELFHVMYWVARTYAREPEDAPHPSLAFDAAAIPRPMTAEQRKASMEALRHKQQENAKRDEELAKTREDNAALQAELDQLRAQVAEAKAAADARPDDHDYDEQETRDRYIDLLLREAGWPLDRPQDREFEVDGMPNEQGRGFVDYVLWGEDGLPLAVVEAKRTRRDATEGRQQAKLYADCLQRRYGRRPVIFYSNGYDHWLWDDVRYSPRRVQGFFTKDELELLLGRRASARRLAEVEIDAEIVERHYQQRAIRRIAEAFERDRQRKALVVMATGAGKTRTVIALTKLLMEGGWVKRALFLADRVALVNQATAAFKAHLPDVTTVNLVSENASTSSSCASSSAACAPSPDRSGCAARSRRSPPACWSSSRSRPSASSRTSSASWPTTSGGSTSRCRCSRRRAGACAASSACSRSASASSCTPTSSTSSARSRRSRCGEGRPAPTSSASATRRGPTCAPTSSTSRCRDSGATVR